MSEYILEMKNISKSFSGVKALDNVMLQVKPGEVHALMGENGAGKSTLMKILMGIYSSDGGEIIMNGRKYKADNPKEAMNVGISMIHQELNPILDMPVYENIFVGRELHKGVLVDKAEELKEAGRLLDDLEISVSPQMMLRDLSVAQCQLIEIIKAISIKAKVIIMDEPTSAITDHEVKVLFSHIESLRKQGTAIIYISHRMEEIFKICDRITVMRDGQYVGTDTVKNLDENKLIKMMVGREITDVFPKMEAEIGEVVLKAKNISRGKRVKDVSFDLRRGEILGIAGLVGAGRTELVEGLFGIEKLSAGEIYIHDQKVSIHSPRDAIKHGLALITEDRKGSGLNLGGTVEDNITTIAIKKLLKGGLVNKSNMRKATDEYIDKLKIKTSSRDQAARNLSGGNQQKIVISKWLLAEPEIMIMDEPTRGIDVGAKRDIYLLMGELVKNGKSVIVISSEIPELMGICDRIFVMAEGEMTGELSRGEFSQENIMVYASAIEA